MQTTERIVTPAGIPEILQLVVQTAERASDDAWFQTKVLKQAMSELVSLDFDRTAAEVAFEILTQADRLLGKADAYEADKKAANQAMLSLLPQLRDLAATQDQDPLAGAVRLAATAAALPFPALPETPVLRRMLEEGIHQTQPVDDTLILRDALKGAKSVLYILDRCGEAVADRVLIEMLGNKEVACVVRRAPILSCMTLNEAVSIGMDAMAQVLDPGAEMLGIVQSLCSKRFLRAFTEADVVIAKGPENFVTLAGSQRQVFFMFKPRPADVSYLRVRPDQWVVLQHEPASVTAKQP